MEIKKINHYFYSVVCFHYEVIWARSNCLFRSRWCNNQHKAGKIILTKLEKSKKTALKFEKRGRIEKDREWNKKTKNIISEEELKNW